MWLQINSSDSTTASSSSFQNSISGPYSVLEQKRLSTAVIFLFYFLFFLTSSVVENSATSNWLQKTFCSEANKASHGPSSGSGGLQFLIFLVPDPELYLVKRPIRGLEAKSGVFVAAAGNGEE